MEKPRLFIAASVEGLKYARAMQVNLERDAEITVWENGVFGPSQFSLESLLERLDLSDFAAFVFSTDDITKIRGSEYNAVRDNVVFELGLFMGHLGRESCFIVQPQSKSESAFRVPSDLTGLNPIHFESTRSDENWEGALAAASHQIRKAMQKQSSEHRKNFISQSVPEGFSKGSLEWLNEHLFEVRSAIIAEATSIAKMRDGTLVMPAEIAKATGQFAPGGRVRGSSWFSEKILGSLSGVTFVAAVLAVAFGAMGLATNQAIYFDIVKLFAGTILGSAGANVVANVRGK